MSVFKRMVAVPNLKPLDFQSQEEWTRFRQHMDDVVIPEIIEAVTKRERNAVEARKLFIS